MTTLGAKPGRDYTAFDKKLLAHIEAGRNTMAALSSSLEDDAKPFASKPGEEFRVVDRRLQALRKKGLIAWERRGPLVVWYLTK